MESNRGGLFGKAYESGYRMKRIGNVLGRALQGLAAKDQASTIEQFTRKVFSFNISIEFKVREFILAKKNLADHVNPGSLAEGVKKALRGVSSLKGSSAEAAERLINASSINNARGIVEQYFSAK